LYSLALAVGQSEFIDAEEPDAIAPMRCANVGCRYNLPLTSVPNLGQVATYAVEKKSCSEATIRGIGIATGGEESRNVLEEGKAGSNVPKHSDALIPEVAGVDDASALAGEAVRLAREATSDDNRKLTASRKEAISGDVLNGAEVGDGRESVGKDGTRVGVDFGEGEGAEP
jgi:hypothetical protein